MAGEWQTVQLREATETVTKGTTPTTLGGRFANAGVSFIKVESITEDGRIDMGRVAFIDEESDGLLKRSRIQVGDVLFTIAGSIGRAALVRTEHLPANTNQAVAIVRADRSRLTPAFLFYALRDRERVLHAQTRVVQSVQANFSLTELRSLELLLPPLAEQEAIASVLGALDDKIELNRRMNSTLEAMARALFASWRESFEGEIEEHLVQELLDERLLVIGDGYRAKNSEFKPDGLPFVRAGNLKGDGLDLRGAEILGGASVAAAGHKISRPGDVAFTSKGTVGRMTLVSSKTAAFVYSPQVCFWRSLDRSKLHPNVLHRWMTTEDFTRQVAAVSGQTDMAPYVSLQDQRRMVVRLPTPSAQHEMASLLEPIDEMVAANAEQSRNLASLRDALLPKLLSGELMVANAAEAEMGV